MKLLIDHDFNHKILRGLIQRIPNLNFVTAAQLGRNKATDKEHLEWALENQCVTISHDVNTMTEAANSKLKNGESIYGLIIVPQEMLIGHAIKELEIIIGCADEREFTDFIQYLPIGLT